MSAPKYIKLEWKNDARAVIQFKVENEDCLMLSDNKRKKSLKPVYDVTCSISTCNIT